MKRSRLRYYILISILLHILLFWLLHWLPSHEPVTLAPVAIRVLNPPSPSVPGQPPKPPAAERPKPKKPPKGKPGGVLAELPKPKVEARPDEARIVSRYDSRAQDIGPGDAGTRKPSGQKPPQLPPELNLPERYSQSKPPAPQAAAPPPTPSAPKRQARVRPAPRKPHAPKQQPKVSKGTVPEPSRRDKPREQRPEPEERRFRITSEQEVAMLQRQREESEQARKQAMEEHFARLQRALPLPTFDAPGVYEQGAEQPGEGSSNNGGGKFRSIDAFGLKHFSYLIGVKRKIELVFSIPFFSPHQGRIGTPIVGFTIQRNGQLSEAVLLRSSGYDVVDQALLNAVKRAAPYGPFPNHLPDKEISIRVYATVS